MSVYIKYINAIVCYAVGQENTRVLCSVPELLKALARLVEMHDEEPPMLTAEDWEQAREAIAKAGYYNEPL